MIAYENFFDLQEFDEMPDVVSVGLSDLLVTIERYFKNCRFNSKVHLGSGDIRMTIGMQEEILKMIAEATNKEFKEIG